MKTTLYFVRHGQSLKNLHKITQGMSHDEENPLTAMGVDQATSLSQKLAKVNFDYCYTSPHKRAVQTADICLKSKPVSRTIEPDIREKEQGESVGKSTKDTIESYDDWDSITEDERLDKKQFVGEESQRELRARVLALVKKVTKQHNGQTVLMVTHGGLMRALYTYLENKSFKEMWKFDNCGYMVVESDVKSSIVTETYGLRLVNKHDLY